ncbi:MAG TPA: DMT family transporter [Planctomycetota bacterium]|nr:DMT family transporter [Planctomycetota bacterium]
MEAPVSTARRIAADPSRPYLWMLFGSACFGAMAALTKLAAERCDWRIVTFARAGFMLVFAAAWSGLRGAPFVLFRPAAMWVRSAAGTAAMLCTFYAYTHLPLGDASTLIYMVPVWVTLLSWPLLGERPTLRISLAVGLCLLGVTLIARPHFRDAGLGAVAALASSFFTATVMMSLKRLQNVDPRTVVVHFSLLSTLAFAILCGASAEARAGLRAIDLPLLGLLVGVGLVGTAGQIGLTRAFAEGPPSRVSLVGMTQILFGVLADLAVWSRGYDAWTLLGMGLVAAPTAWILLRGRGS